MRKRVQTVLVAAEAVVGVYLASCYPIIQYGTKIRLKGKGFPVYRKEGETGDLYVTYEIKLPVNLTEQQKALFTELFKLQ